MVLIIVLNLLFAVGVLAAVITPLMWAIFTQHRDHAALETVSARSRPAAQYTRRRRQTGIAVAQATQPSKA